MITKMTYLPHNYEQNTIVYTGTHDNDTSIGWYATATEHEKDHVRRYMNINGENIAWDLIRLAMSSTAVFSIFPMQDVLRLDSNYRMNTPSVSNGNWQFRFELSHLKEEDVHGLYYLTELFNRLPQKKPQIEKEKTIIAEKEQEEIQKQTHHTKKQKRKKR